MLKYQVRTTKFTPSPSPSTSGSSSHRTIITIKDDFPAISHGAFRASSTSLSSTSNSSASSFLSSINSSRPASIRFYPTRSNSMSSLSSIDSSESAEWGHLKVYTSNIKGETDYKTLKINNQTTTRQVIEQVLSKYRQPCKDLNLYQLWMEVQVKSYNGQDVKTMLELDIDSKPLELQRCHPSNQSKFILHQISGHLVKIHDSELCKESNYKSLLISPKTTAIEVVILVLQMARISANASEYRLYVVDEPMEAPIPDELLLVTIYKKLSNTQKIVIKKI